MAEATRANFTAADEFLGSTLVGEDPVLDRALAAQRRAGLPDIEVTPLAGKFLNLLVRMSGARRVLEIGTLGGYSTIWLARAVPADGQVVTIEAEQMNADIARKNIDDAGVGEKVDIRVGRAADVLLTLDSLAPFDFVFIDADKESNTLYLDWAARLGRAGTVVVVDNIGRDGEIVNSSSGSSKVQGTRDSMEMLGRDPRFDATALQTVGAKGWDGVAIALLK